MKSPHLSHQVGWLRLADMNLCPRLVTGDLSSWTSSNWSPTQESLEPRSRGTALLRDRISDDGFTEDCDETEFCRLLVMSDSPVLSILAARPGKPECLLCDFAADSGLAVSDDEFRRNIMTLNHGFQLTSTAHLNWKPHNSQNRPVSRYLFVPRTLTLTINQTKP